MDGFLIRTASGDKGPFDIFQLEKLVAAGKIPRTLSVIDPETGLSLPLVDLLPEEPLDVSLPTEALPEDPAGPTALPAHHRSGAVRAPTRGGRAKGRGKRRSREPRPVAHRLARGAAPHRASRYTGTLHKKSKVAPILLIIFVVAAVGGGGGYILWRDLDRPLVGTWKLDVETLKKMHGQRLAGMSEPEREFAESMLEGLLGNAQFVFTESHATIIVFGQEMKGDYRIVAERAGVYDLEVVSDGVTERVSFTVTGRRGVLDLHKGEAVPLIRS